MPLSVRQGSTPEAVPAIPVFPATELGRLSAATAPASGLGSELDRVFGSELHRELGRGLGVVPSSELGRELGRELGSGLARELGRALSRAPSRM